MADLRRGLVAACDDPRLFGFELWPRQRELLEAVEVGPRIHVWAVGRRSGKSTLAALTCLWDCLLRPECDAMVRPGETRFSVAVATNLSQARLIVNAARSVVERSPVLAGLLAGQTEDELRFALPSGAKTCLRAFPCSSRGGRGWPISCLVQDESAHFLTESDGDRTSDRIWSALTPSTAQFGDLARIIVSSTPYGESGLFATLFDRASKGEIEDAVATHLTTAEVNPTIGETFLAQEQGRDPDSFASEYLARFVGSGDTFIDFERVALLGAPVAGPRTLRVGWPAWTRRSARTRLAWLWWAARRTAGWLSARCWPYGPRASSRARWTRSPGSLGSTARGASRTSSARQRSLSGSVTSTACRCASTT